MRILHVIPQLWRGNGAAKIVKDLVDYQITHGNLVTVVSLSIMSPSYEKDLKKLGCEVIYLENRRYSLYNPKFFFQLRKIIKEFDIVHRQQLGDGKRRDGRHKHHHDTAHHSRHR